MRAFVLTPSVSKILRWSGSRSCVTWNRKRFCQSRNTVTRAQIDASEKLSFKIPELPQVDRILEFGMGVVVLKRGKARLFRDGRNPLVFGGAIEKIIAPKGQAIRSGDRVAVCDGASTCLGFGFFNAESMFRVRILRHVSQNDTNLSLPWYHQEDLNRRLHDAVSLRRTLGLCNSNNTVYRLINGEGDRLSGLVVDNIGDTLVISSSAQWCERYKEDILLALSHVLPECRRKIWRQNVERLKQDGYVIESRQQENITSIESERTPSAISPTLETENADSVLVYENSIKYLIPGFALTRGQKTGHYADQRENRAFVRELIRQRGGPCRVLDLFCYTGGFSLNSALGHNETKIVAIDSSGPAISMAQRNAELNNVQHQINFIQSDVIKYLRGVTDEDYESYDIVIVDPPKFAPNAKALPRATHKYKSLNHSALKMVKRGGLLITCTCSAAMTKDRGLFIEIMRTAALQLGREITMVKMFGAAADHPIIPEVSETEYLTVFIFACQ